MKFARSRAMMPYVVAGILSFVISLICTGCGCPTCKVPQSEPAIKILTISNQYGAKRLLESEKGKTIILHFWATSCGICRPELETLNRYYKQMDRERQALYAITSENSEEVREFAQRRLLAFPIVVDQSGTFASEYKIESLPVTVVLAPGANVRRFDGPQDWRRGMKNLLTTLLTTK